MIKQFLPLLRSLVLGLTTSLVAESAAHAQQAPARAVTLNLTQLRQQLAPALGSTAHPGEASTYRISLPTLQGNQAFLLTETHILPATDTVAS